MDKRMLGRDNPSSRLGDRPGWSIVEELIRWFAEQEGAPPEQMSSPSFMIERITEYLHPSMPKSGIEWYQERRRTASMVSNWRRDRRVSVDAWGMLRELTGAELEHLWVSWMKVKDGDQGPIAGFRIPGPARSGVRRSDRLVPRAGPSSRRGAKSPAKPRLAGKHQPA